jgi:hypothetical protein
MAVFGIDVSQWRGAINWPEVAASGLATFASTRVIDGEVPDSRWEANARGARDHIALPIAHARVKPGDQAGRARRFLDMTATIHDLATVGLMVDVEDVGVTVADGMAFCRAVHDLVGRHPLAYVPAWWLAGKPGWTLPQTPWWPSRYVPQPWTPQALEVIRPALHPGFAMMGPWQFTSSGTVPGVPPPADRNIFFGTQAELGRLLRGETMATIIPFADWRPLPEATSQPKITPRTVIYHTAVGRLATTERFFRDSTGVESHLMVGGPWDGPALDGVIWQWMTLDRQADANLDANRFAISIETSDNAPLRPEDIAPWSPKQLAALVRLGNWLADTYGIPRRICPAWDQAGFGWHVLFGAPSHWTPVAKACPGPVRIRQLKDIVLPAIFAGQELEADMPLTEAEWKRLETLLDLYSRKSARWTDHGDDEVTGASNHLVRVREDLRLLGEATGKRLDALEELLTPDPPTATTTPTGES